MRIGYKNGIISDQLSASSYFGDDYVVANLLDLDMPVTWKAESAGSGYISFRDNSVVGSGNSEMITASMFCVNNHNLLEGDTFTLSGYTTETGTTPSVSYTFTYHEYGMAMIFDEATYYWAVTFNTTNILEIGGIFLGTHLITPAYEIGASTTHTTTDSYSVSKSGQLGGDEGYYKRLATYLLPHVTEEQKQELLDLWLEVGTRKQFYLLQYPDRQDIQQLFYCHLTSNSMVFQEHEKNRSLFKDLSISIEEVF